MYLKIFLLIGISSLVHARDLKNIQVTFKRETYNLKINKTSIQYLDQFTDLSIGSIKCSEPLFKEMKSTIDQYLSHPFKPSNEPQNILIKIDQESFYEPENTTRAKFFLNFLDYMKIRKTEELFNCKSN